MIYFVQAVDGGPVKIGYSADVPNRLKQLEIIYGKPLALLATMPGDRLKERELHANFSHLRFGRTEQFRPAADLMTFIGRPLMVSANPDTVEVMENHWTTVLNVKGTREERDTLHALSRATGVPVSEITRRGIALWAAKRGFTKLPDDWIVE